jgi:hypothetical protein
MYTSLKKIQTDRPIPTLTLAQPTYFVEILFLSKILIVFRNYDALSHYLLGHFLQRLPFLCFSQHFDFLLHDKKRYFDSNTFVSAIQYNSCCFGVIWQSIKQK